MQLGMHAIRDVRQAKQFYNLPMTVRVALYHRTSYQYDRLVALSPQLIRLRPSLQTRSTIFDYSLTVQPETHSENWQQDPHGNFMLRCVFSERVQQLIVEVRLTVDMSPVNPFEFFIEPSAESWPFEYEPWLARDLRPYLECEPVAANLSAWLASVDRTQCRTVDFLIALNNRVRSEIAYLIRMEPGVQTPEETLESLSGSCRDTAWLLIQILRNLGIAARFVSGYLIQLFPNQPQVDPAHFQHDIGSLHAWTEVYLPGAGWIGFDTTSGMLTSEGHIPLACTPGPGSAAPITGSVTPCETTFDYALDVKRLDSTHA